MNLLKKAGSSFFALVIISTLSLSPVFSADKMPKSSGKAPAPVGAAPAKVNPLVKDPKATAKAIKMVAALSGGTLQKLAAARKGTNPAPAGMAAKTAPQAEKAKKKY